jgi:hypothetical protein
MTKKVEELRKQFCIDTIWNKYEEVTEPFQVDELIFISIDLGLDIESELFAAWRIDSQEMMKNALEN